MNNYVIIDKVSKSAEQVMGWTDGRAFPSTWILKDNEQVITIDSKTVVQPDDVYDVKLNKFYVLDITDTETSKSQIQSQLADLELVLPELQEVTWSATVGFDEAKLPKVWVDRLTQKRTLRAKLASLESPIIPVG
jgi:hypothetical protein